jgi:hypothetical protein
MKKVLLFRRPVAYHKIFLLLLLSLPSNFVAQDTTGAAPSPTPASASAAAPTLQFSISVPPDIPLWDTGITLRAGDSVEISATQGACNPSGLGRHAELLQSLPVPGAHFGALIGRLGHDDPLVIGEHFLTDIQTQVPLFLGANTDGEAACSEQFQVQVSIRPQVGNTVTVTDRAALITHLDRLPRRVTDASGHPGDPLNFVLIGPYQAVKAALSAAHWSVADERKLPAAVHAVLATWAHENYVQMPMSKLYCFGRVQDFGYELAKPIKVAASRHHFRLWLVPWQANGRNVWIGAATHDIGFTKDHRNGHLTHKIDANVDDERDFLLHSLAKDDVTDSPFYFTPLAPVREAYNASGDRFYSDGRVLVVSLNSPPAR